MKKKLLVIVTSLAAMGAANLAQAAQFTGKVTLPDGVTPAVNLPVSLYKFDAESASYFFNSFTQTNSTGNFVAVPSGATSTHLGGYYIVFGNDSQVFQSDPFQPFTSYYSSDSNPFSIYYQETYNDVTALTPTRAPTQLVVTSPTQSTALALVKLNRRTSGCRVTGPMTINGVPYTFFSSAGLGPFLPATGGPLNISFSVQNLSAAAITTSVQSIAFLNRRDAAGNAAGNQRGVATAISAAKSVTIPANATAPVTMNVTTIPATFMAVSPASASTSRWAFNVGINATAAGVPNCFTMALFPVLNPPTAAAAAESLPELPQPIIPLTLSKDGKPVQWGPMPK